MSTLRRIAAMVAVSGLASLFGVNCASSNDPMSPGDDTEVGTTVDPGEAALSSGAATTGDQADAERSGESQDRQVGHLPAAPAPPPGTTTFSCAGFWNGLYCGGNAGFPGSTHALYYCYNGVGTLVQVCPGPCKAMPVGVEDRC